MKNIQLNVVKIKNVDFYILDAEMIDDLLILDINDKLILDKNDKITGRIQKRIYKRLKG